MPYKNPEDKLAWQKANKDRCNEYRLKWLEGSAGQAYLAKQKAKIEIQKRITAEKRQQQKLLRGENVRKYDSQKHRAYRKRQRQKAIDLLGAVCQVCGMDDADVLQFDHIEPLFRKTVQHKNKDVYKEVINHHSPSQDFQLLCANCHIKKTRMNGEYEYTPPRFEPYQSDEPRG
jgi:5-methylcytosine-specific restriction endonuclease McrA